ncbi:asparagine synthase C-terminal domain-containing protein, partial [Oligoflexia bacterium]|nr:asparagine synthase C-terminal domain-containing protein [Oligoflexia bacterium]
SQIPTYLVSKLAREHVTVSLSGDGGDELFCGYTRYFLGAPIWKLFSAMPYSLKRAVSTALTSISASHWDRVYELVRPVLPKQYRQNAVGYKVHKLAELMRFKKSEDFYGRLISHWSNPEEIVLQSEVLPTFLTDERARLSQADFLTEMMFLDLITYLPDDILTKVDRASMGVSLEARVPLLDHRVVELAWQLPKHMKLQNKVGKLLLREILYKYVPKELIERPKMGFGIPVHTWLRGPLRDWAEELLSEKRLKEDGFFNPSPIRQKWQEHLTGKGNWHYYLWDVLMFQAWASDAYKGT